MAITQTQRILDLAVAGLDTDQIAHALNVAETVVQTALQDLTSAPSGQAGVALPVAKSAAYTKTYNTPGRTVPAATYAAVTVTSSQNATATATDLTTSEALANALKTSYNAAQVDIAALNVALIALAADVLALKQLIVALVTDLQAVQIAG